MNSTQNQQIQDPTSRSDYNLGEEETSMGTHRDFMYGIIMGYFLGNSIFHYLFYLFFFILLIHFLFYFFFFCSTFLF